MKLFRSRKVVDGGDHEHILRDIALLLGVASENPGASDEVLVAALGSAGVSERQAWRLVLFVPIAFGRAVVAGFGIDAPKDYILRVGPRYKNVHKRLRDEPEYRAATDHLSDFAGQKGFKDLAARGPEVNALNNALHDGVDPTGASLQPPVVWLRD